MMTGAEIMLLVIVVLDRIAALLGLWVDGCR